MDSYNWYYGRIRHASRPNLKFPFNNSPSNVDGWLAKMLLKVDGQTLMCHSHSFNLTDNSIFYTCTQYLQYHKSLLLKDHLWMFKLWLLNREFSGINSDEKAGGGKQIYRKYDRFPDYTLSGSQKAWKLSKFCIKPSNFGNFYLTANLRKLFTTDYIADTKKFRMTPWLGYKKFHR